MIVLTGGGTGGHLSIVKSIKDELNKIGILPVFVGSSFGQDRAWFEDSSGFEAKYFLDSSGVMNKNSFGKIKMVSKLIKYAISSKEIFKKHNINKVFSVGGYSSFPASLGAVIYNKKLYIHEQNAIMGNSNRLLSKFAKNIFSSFGDNPYSYPVADIFFDRARVRKKINKIIFLGGSQGARDINDFAIEVAKNFKDIYIIHQTGKKDYERVLSEYSRLNITNVYVFDFSTTLIEKIVDADFAVTRAGASTMFELVANQIPSLFIPYPFAANNHQYYNANYLASKGLGFLSTNPTIKELNSIINSDIEEISIKLQNLISRDGAKSIVEKVLNG
jgi:UDP-N-acetylglucosamine--N-acetylmuramyl-(pentapeptide) pyrophosphoryl-undecaprenol N-acetylglucosamine transferase